MSQYLPPARILKRRAKTYDYISTTAPPPPLLSTPVRMPTTWEYHPPIPTFKIPSATLASLGISLMAPLESQFAKDVKRSSMSARKQKKLELLEENVQPVAFDPGNQLPSMPLLNEDIQQDDDENENDDFFTSAIEGDEPKPKKSKKSRNKDGKKKSKKHCKKDKDNIMLVDMDLEIIGEELDEQKKAFKQRHHRHHHHRSSKHRKPEESGPQSLEPSTSMLATLLQNQTLNDNAEQDMQPINVAITSDAHGEYISWQSLYKPASAGDAIRYWFSQKKRILRKWRLENEKKHKVKEEEGVAKGKKKKRASKSKKKTADAQEPMEQQIFAMEF